MRLAGTAAGVLGIAGVRGRTLPVFDLAHALGLRDPEPPHWLALHGADSAAIAFGIPRFLGQVQVTAESLRPTPDSLARLHAPDLVSIDARPVAVIGLASVAQALRGRATAGPNSLSSS